MTYSPEYQRNYYQANKARIRASNDAWARANPGRVAEHRRKTRLKNGPRLRAATRRWEAAHPEAVLHRAAKARAAKLGMSFDIERADIVIPEVCPLLGIALEPRKGGHGPKDSSPSLDRIDNAKGYVRGNVWVISWLANKMKATASDAQLEAFARNVQDWLARRKKGPEPPA